MLSEKNEVHLKNKKVDINHLTCCGFVIGIHVHTKILLYPTIITAKQIKKRSGNQQNIYLPDFEKCPAPSSHLNKRMFLSVFKSLNFATNLAGSEYITRGSVSIKSSISDGLTSDTK